MARCRLSNLRSACLFLSLLAVILQLVHNLTTERPTPPRYGGDDLLAAAAPRWVEPGPGRVEPGPGPSSTVQAMTSMAEEPAVTCPSLVTKKTINIADFGAKGDGTSNDGRALVKAVASLREGGVVEMNQKHLIYPVVFSNLTGVTIRITGTLIAPENPKKYAPLVQSQNWSHIPELARVQYALLEFRNCHNTHVTGRAVEGSEPGAQRVRQLGTVDGNAQKWWTMRSEAPGVRKKRKCPVLVKFHGSTCSGITYLTLQNSPFYHVVVLKSRQVEISHVKIQSPRDAKNTDGIVIMDSHYVDVRRCDVSTGDDNVAVKAGSRHVRVLDSTLRYGHGTSIGSLGEAGHFEFVKDVEFRNLIYKETKVALRIKVWQGGRGYVQNVVAEHLRVVNVGTVVIVDTFYCPSSQHKKPCDVSHDAVNITNVSISRVSGTHKGPVGAMLLCADSAPCEVNIANVDMWYTTQKGSMCCRQVLVDGKMPAACRVRQLHPSYAKHAMERIGQYWAGSRWRMALPLGMQAATLKEHVEKTNETWSLLCSEWLFSTGK